MPRAVLDSVRKEVQINAAYGTYKPPYGIVPSVRRLLTNVPVDAVSGLESIVLSDSDRYATRTRRESALSFYHQQTRDRFSWIELLIDNIFRDFPRWLLVVPLLRETLLAKPLFHEIGHHRDARIGGMRAGAQERRADVWATEMSQQYFGRRYWYLKPFVRVFVKAVRLRRNVQLK